MLKNSFTPRLLKKVQMQGGAPGTHPQDGHPPDWVPGARRTYAYVAAPRERANPPTADRWAFFSSLLDCHHDLYGGVLLREARLECLHDLLQGEDMGDRRLEVHPTGGDQGDGLGELVGVGEGALYR